MADFLKIGSRVINLELITDISIDADKIAIFFAAPSSNGGIRVLTFKDSEAANLREWITTHVKDIDPK